MLCRHRRVDDCFGRTLYRYGSIGRVDALLPLSLETLCALDDIVSTRRFQINGRV